MLKESDYAVYLEWWNYLISKVPHSREVIEPSAKHPGFKKGCHADRARLLLRPGQNGILPGSRKGAAHRGGESNTNNGTAERTEIRMDDWED
jgi:hypothetical protein